MAARIKEKAQKNLKNEPMACCVNSVLYAIVYCWQKIVFIKTVYVSHLQSILLLRNYRRPVDFFVKLKRAEDVFCVQQKNRFGLILHDTLQ